MAIVEAWLEFKFLNETPRTAHSWSMRNVKWKEILELQLFYLGKHFTGWKWLQLSKSTSKKITISPMFFLLEKLCLHFIRAAFHVW